MGYALSGLALIHHVGAEPALALPLYRRALAIFDHLGSSRIALRTRSRIAFLMIDLDRVEEVIPELQAARESARLLRGRWLEGVLTGYLGNAARARGRHEQALAEYAAAIPLLRSVGDRRFAATFTMDSAIVYVLRREHERALDLLARARAEALEMGDARLDRLCSAYQILVALLDGDRERASRASSELCANIDDCVLERVRALLERVLEALAGGGASLDSTIANATSDHERLIAKRAKQELDLRFPPVDALLVSFDGSWLRAPHGVWSALGAYPTQARLLAYLAAERERTPGVALSAERLIEVGWPGERLKRPAALNRLRVALAAHRRAGLGEHLRHENHGYLLDSAVPLVRAAPEN